MGIPKFFRYIAQRWPLSLQLVNDNVIPEFDNLYLDMNSIVHMCTHANAENVGHLDEHQSFVQIGNYIEHLLTIIKPKGHVFMAIDGVAPRAKMNQQRSRRFRSAQEAEEAAEKRISMGLEIEEDPFDSNCITPGTTFMANLSAFLKSFIVRKMNSDSSWQQCKVVLSGHDVPGEGEHKIMNYIRHLRSQPDYDVNTRHCLYGLDADLIMLGLSTHEMHFSLFREEVVFGVQRFKSKELHSQRFNLLHLSVIRAYMKLELVDPLNDVEADFERVLDDLILAMFFLGNDFLPVTPMLMIEEDSIPVIFNTYKEYMRKSGNRYLSLNGEIDFLNLKEWLKIIMSVQIDKFEEVALDQSWLKNQLERITGPLDTNSELKLSADEKEYFVVNVKPFMQKVLRKNDLESSLEIDPQFKRLVHDIASKSGYEFDSNELKLTESADPETVKRVIREYKVAHVPPSTEELEEYASRYNHWRNRYYKRKFQDTYESDVVLEVSRSYLTGLQWVLYYYYRGCASWSWFYPYHYAPMIPELISAIGDGFKPQYELGTPFTPFEQLMAVLPDRSVKLLPPCLRPLVLDEQSPIKSFYPHDFKLDKNNKKALWEAVVLIPFIDGNLLLNTMRPVEMTQLSQEEQARNSSSPELLFEFNPDVSYFYKSSPGEQDIPDCHTVIVPLPGSAYPVRYGLLTNALTGKHCLYGFPQLDTLPFKSSIEKQFGVKVFERPSAGSSVILHIQPTNSKLKAKDRVYAFWPFLCEVEVEKVVPASSVDQRVISGVMNSVGREYKNMGVDIGPTKEFAFVRELLGLRRQPDGSFRKEFSKSTTAFPVQLIVRSVEQQDSRFEEKETLPIEQELPLNSYAVLLTPKFYGFPANILSLTAGSANVEAIGPIGPVGKSEEGNQLVFNDLSRKASHIAAMDTKLRWFDQGYICAQLKIPFKVLNAITSRCMMPGSKRDVNVAFGICNFRAELRAEQYSRMGHENRWELSQLALNVLKEYFSKFPGLAAALKTGAKLDAKVVDEMREFVRSKEDEVTFLPLYSQSLSSEAVKAIEQAQIESLKEPLVVKKIEINGVDRQALLSPVTASHQLRLQQFKLGSRVMSMRTSGKVALFAFGFVVGIQQSPASQTAKSVDVVWDSEFPAGSTLDGKCTTKRGLTVPADSVLNLSSMQLAYKHGKTPKDFTSAKVDANAKPAHRTQKTSSTEGFVPAPVHNDWKHVDNKLKNMVLSEGAKDAKYKADKADKADKDAKNAKSDKSDKTGKETGKKFKSKTGKPGKPDSNKPGKPKGKTGKGAKKPELE